MPSLICHRKTHHKQGEFVLVSNCCPWVTVPLPFGLCGMFTLLTAALAEIFPRTCRCERLVPCNDVFWKGLVVIIYCDDLISKFLSFTRSMVTSICSRVLNRWLVIFAWLSGRYLWSTTDGAGRFAAGSSSTKISSWFRQATSTRKLCLFTTNSWPGKASWVTWYSHVSRLRAHTHPNDLQMIVQFVRQVLSWYSFPKCVHNGALGLNFFTRHNPLAPTPPGFAHAMVLSTKLDNTIQIWCRDEILEFPQERCGDDTNVN